MDTREELEAELKSRLQIAGNSTLFPAARITELIQNAYKWATALIVWPELVRTRATSAKAGHEYYDCPTNFRYGTIVALTIDGAEYIRTNFQAYKRYKSRHPGTTRKMFANYGKQYFVNPTPTVTGVNNLIVAGAIEADGLDLPTSQTIFSTNKETANEAVVKKALSVAKELSDKGASSTALAGATADLMKISDDEWAETALDEMTETPKWDVPDFFAPGNSNLGSSNIGRFNSL